jgi:hypothetical protein
MKTNTLKWKVNTPNFLKEIGSNNQMSIMSKPLMIFASILGEVAYRASELNDPKLNSLMARLALYEITDPYSKEYDANKTRELIKLGENDY